MAYTVIESIAKEIVRRLVQIRPSNGYSHNVTSVIRPNRNATWTPEDRLILVKQGDSTKNEALSCPGNPPAIAFDTTFELCSFVRTSDFYSVEYESIENDRGAQIIKAITTEATDPSMWQTMGGNAFNTEFGPLENMDADDGEYHGKTVNVTCFYRVSENNPFELRA
jgi:hypothetical protein